MNEQTPLGLFEDHWMYCHACNFLRNGVYQINAFTEVMILPAEPIKYFTGPERIHQPSEPDWRDICWRVI